MPDQPPAVEARVVAMRTGHPTWGARTIVYWLAGWLAMGWIRCLGGLRWTGA